MRRIRQGIIAPACLVVAVLVGCSMSEPVNPQPFELYTHCGLDQASIEFDGTFWKAAGPGPLSDGSGNPPPGFGNPFDRGSIARTGNDTALFVSSQGVRLDLVRLVNRPDVPPCR